MQERILDRWFLQLTNTKIYLISYLMGASILIVAMVNIFNIVNKNDVSTVSVQHFQNKFLEKEKYINDYFNSYISSLNILSENIYLNKYIRTKSDKEVVENLFLTIEKSFPDVFQIRLLDMQGVEQIRTERIVRDANTNDTQFYVVPSSLLQDKSNRDYFEQFKGLSQGKIGISNIDLNIEHNEIELPKKATIRLGKVLYDNQGVKRGMLIYNISLHTFFKKLNESTFYNIYIIDNKGRYIMNNNNHGGIEGDYFESMTIFNTFEKKIAEKILTQPHHYGERFYSAQIDNLKNSQNLKMVMDLKFEHISQDITSLQNKFIYILIFIALALLPVVYFFSKIPEIMQKRMNNNKNIDELTKVPNRRCLFIDLQQQEFQQSVIVLIQINNYVKIQNIYGHEISNKLMKMVAESLNECTEKHLTKVYRYNNEGFALKYNYSNLPMMKSFLRKLHEYLESHTFHLEDNIDLILDITIGASSPEQLNNNIDELKEAEVALEHAIDQKHDYFIYKNLHPHSVEANKKNLKVAQSVKQAIDDQKLELHYQPIINNASGKIEKYETLMRIKNGEQLLFPDTFIPIAKELKKYKALTRILVEQSFAYFQNKPYEFSINLSIEDIQDETFQTFLFSKIDEYKVHNKLVVEIVESENIHDYQFFYTFIKNLKEVKCKVAIDDFGSGYSNFQHIIALSDYIDYIKLDGSLVRDILTDHKAQKLVKNIKLLCEELSLKTIAEYVENNEVFNYLKALGIDYSQGYYIGKPSSIIRHNLDAA
ncbi:EAL domain-containing protein [Sulfurimonas marina]|uniref:GGDEF domain-containing protein n=1 Tax=Sulfurimonas marina TaxID=2590551 RepID=A0A7M1AUG2_9BACT|nr:EAL domain-containing protein [Sulfurimonas marina]QOP41063.1 GGDEF domain-containing protein [Sulfurimonas marina]